MMKTLKVKLAIFSLLAITLVSGLFVSCEQAIVTTPTIEVEEGITQAEVDAAKAEFDLIMSYGEEVATAYTAYLEGETLTYYPPVGVYGSVDFDWSNYHAIMEHSKISYMIHENDAYDIYEDNLSSGTYLTKEHVQELTPELAPVLDNVTVSDIQNRAEWCPSQINGCPVVNGGWQRCGPCHTMYYLGRVYYARDRCLICDTTCACHAPLNVRRWPGC